MTDDKFKDKVGLALSGGGFRAALFHCGALIRLNELGYLPKIDRISSVSGGSIASARLAAAWSKLTFDSNGTAPNFDEHVVEPLREFCRLSLDVKSILSGIVPFGHSAPSRLAEAYDKHLLGGMTLDRLPIRPDFVFNATNLQTGRSFRFERKRVADYKIGQITNTARFPVSLAVAASSAFPPVLSPVIIDLEKTWWSDMEGTEFFGQDDYMERVFLTDGGVYDNLGLERIDHFGTILCSDAGKPFDYGKTYDALSLKQVLRALDIAADQSRGLRTRMLIDSKALRGKTPCYWGIDQGETKDPAPGLLPRSAKKIIEIAKIRTRLNRFDDSEQGLLINWGYASCDERMRSYVLKSAPPPNNVPEPNYPID